MNYIQVIDGQIQGYPRPLPKYAFNISNFDLLPKEKVLEYGWYPVRFVPNPNKTETSVAIGQNFVIEGDEVVQYEQIREKTQEELQQEANSEWENIREERNNRLFQCDWTQISDSPLNEILKQQWAEYRQSLRDLPEVYSDPNDVVWPTEPGSRSY